MAHDRPHRDLRTHVEAVAGRRPAETEQLMRALAGRVWPGGGDRCEPAAAEWIRRWGPSRGRPVASACACAQGVCGVCN